MYICILAGQVINQFGGFIFGGLSFTFRKLESKIISSSEKFMIRSFCMYIFIPTGSVKNQFGGFPQLGSGCTMIALLNQFIKIIRVATISSIDYVQLKCAIEILSKTMVARWWEIKVDHGAIGLKLDTITICHGHRAFGILISHIDNRYIDTFWKYWYQYW